MNGEYFSVGDALSYTKALIERLAKSNKQLVEIELRFEFAAVSSAESNENDTHSKRVLFFPPGKGLDESISFYSMEAKKGRGSNIEMSLTEL